MKKIHTSKPTRPASSSPNGLSSSDTPAKDGLKNLPLSYAGTSKSKVMQVKTAPAREMSQAEIQALEKKQRDYVSAQS